MKKTSKPKKATNKPKKGPRKVAKKEPLKTGSYVRVIAISQRIGLDERLKWALVGMVLPVISPNEPMLQVYIEAFERDFDTFEGYFVESSEIVRNLNDRDLRETAFFFSEDVPYPFFWFPPESCEEIKKENLN